MSINLLAATFIMLGIAGLHADSVQVTWGYNSSSAAVRLLASDGATPLSGADNGGVAGSGYAVELGYYTQATTANPFAGTWVPVFGKGDANSLFANSSLGDGRSTTDATDIRFSETGIIDSAVPGTLTNLPLAGQIMAIRFYNATQSANATYYGAASNPAWTWVGAASPPALPMSYNASQSGTVFQGAAAAETNQRTFTGQLQLTTQPTNTSGSAGSPVSLTVAANGPALTYQWYFNGNPIPGATTSNYSLALSSATTGSYTVVGTDAYGDTVSGGPYVVSISGASVVGADTPAMPLWAELALATLLLLFGWRGASAQLLRQVA